MDAAQISALLVGTAGVITALGTYLNSASKGDLERFQALLTAQDKRAAEQDRRISELETDVAALSRSNRILRRVLIDNKIEIPTEALIDGIN